MYIMGYLPYQLVSQISEPSTVAPENGWLEDEFPFGAPAYFQVRLLLVSERVIFCQGEIPGIHK